MNIRKTLLQNWPFGLLVVLALAIGAYAFIFYGDSGQITEQPFTMEKGKLPELWYDMLWAHAVSAGLALAVGWLQFMKRLRARLLWLHRILGLLYAAAIAVGAATGLYLALYADGGWVARVGFAALSIAWMITLYRGLASIFADRDPAAHGRWMLRNYALTCAAITLRIYVALAVAIFGLTDNNDTFAVIAWLCWVPNLLVAQLLIARRPKTTRRSLSLR